MRDTCRDLATSTAVAEQADQRARLLAAAASVLSDGGYAGMTIARVCDRAGMSNTTFYEEFEDREACFLALFERTVAQATSAAVEACDGAQAWRNQVRSGLASLLGFLDAEPQLASIAVVDALGTGPRVLARRAQVLDLLATVVADGRLEATVGNEPPALTADVAVGGAFSVIHTRLLDGDSGPLLALLDPLMSTIVAPYLGPEAAAQELDR
jgi:AcrR family transcriptional regulator